MKNASLSVKDGGTSYFTGFLKFRDVVALIECPRLAHILLQRQSHRFPRDETSSCEQDNHSVGNQQNANSARRETFSPKEIQERAGANTRRRDRQPN